MQEKLSTDRENQDANEESQAVLEVTSEQVLSDMQRMVRSAAGNPEGWGDNVKVAIARAAHALGITAREAKAWWYRERGEPPHSYYLRVKARYEALCEREAKKNALGREQLVARTDFARRHGKRNADHPDLSGESLSSDR
jgi:hypothetical protein